MGSHKTAICSVSLSLRRDKVLMASREKKKIHVTLPHIGSLWYVIVILSKKH
jgi:hypothetical protein